METKIKNRYVALGDCSHICGIEFNPLRKTELKLYHKCGDVVKRSFLGIPIGSNVYHEDVYMDRDNNAIRRFWTKGELIRYNRIIKDGIVYKKAEVRIEYNNTLGSRWEYFETDADAKVFIDKLLDKCKEIGNCLI